MLEDGIEPLTLPRYESSFTPTASLQISHVILGRI